LPACEVRTRDKRCSRQPAISAGARCDDTYTSGIDASRVGPEEPQAVRQAVTAVMTTVAEAGRRSLFMVRSSAFPVMRENMVRGRSVTRFNLKWRRDVMLRDETVIHLQATCKHGGKRSGQSQYTHHLSARSLPDSLSAITMRHRDRCIERVKRMKKPAT